MDKMIDQNVEVIFKNQCILQIYFMKDMVSGMIRVTLGFYGMFSVAKMSCIKSQTTKNPKLVLYEKQSSHLWFLLIDVQMQTHYYQDILSLLNVLQLSYCLI